MCDSTSGQRRHLREIRERIRAIEDWQADLHSTLVRLDDERKRLAGMRDYLSWLIVEADAET